MTPSFTFAWTIVGDPFEAWSKSVRRFPDASTAYYASVQWRADLARHGIPAEVDVVEVVR